MSLILKFYYFYVGCIIIPVITGVWYFRYLDKSSRVLLWMLILALFQSILTLFVLNGEDFSDKWVENLYIVVDIIMMYWFYYTASESQIFRQILLLVYLSMISLYFVSTKLETSINFFPGFQSLIFNATALLFFNYLLKSNSNKSILDNPLFWFNTGLLLNSIVLVLRIYSSVLAEESFGYYQQLYIFFYMIGISVNLLFAIGFRKSKT